MRTSSLAFLFAACCALLFVPVSCGESTTPPTDDNGLAVSCNLPAEACNNQCIDTSSDAANCGGCGLMCPTGSQCGGGECTCNPGLSACSQGCVNKLSDGENCGACNNNCATQGMFCSAGACTDSCAANETTCGSSCVDTSSDIRHCGMCSRECDPGMACQNGQCSCPIGQQLCPSGSCAATCPTDGNPPPNGGGGAGNGGAGNGGAGNGGADNGGANTGGSPPVVPGENPPPPAAAVTCMDPIYGSVTIAPEAMISDFASGEPRMHVSEGRGEGADPWHAFAAGDVNDETTNKVSTPSESNPLHANNAYEVDPATSGPCNAGGALHVISPGNYEWGMGFGIDFMARDAAYKKKTYDASKYTGIGFWAKATKDVPFVYFKVVDGHEDADVAPEDVASVCSYSDQNALCNQFGIKNATITKNWTYYKVYFDELLQDPAGSRFTDKVDPSKLTAFQLQINPRTNRTGNKVLNDLELWVDDVHFLTEPAPSIPADPVSYTTSGNQIMRNGSPHRIRGLVRPSMEWDEAGFGISREDIQRMKGWGANTIRLAVMDTFWSQDIYKRHVKRAIGWILQEGMDAILDLHYVAGMPDAENAAFWSDVSKDPFFNGNGRIIFELYNEPTGDFGQLQQWMQSTTNTIRQSADNLILVGGVDYSYDISGYANSPVSGGGVAYVTHPYVFKTSPAPQQAYISVAANLPVVATEFGDANVEGFRTVAPDQCDPAPNSSGIQTFEANGISWTAWAWIIDSWGCGFPQLLNDYSGEPNAIGVPVRDALMSL